MNPNLPYGALRKPVKQLKPRKIGTWTTWNVRVNQDGVISKINNSKPAKMVTKFKNPIRRRTKSRAKEEAIYRKRAKEWLIKNPVCASCLWAKSECIHHKNGRAGKLLLAEEFWMPCCNKCHENIHQYPNQARKYGFLCEVGQFNNQILRK